MNGKVKLKILYMGSPDFAIEPLKYLINSGYEIVGVVTQPDKPAKRGKKITPPPVKEFALKHNLKIFQPETLKKSVVGDIFLKMDFDFIVTAAYGKILPDWFLKLPSKLAINIHPSLLPKYRGAAPINWAIINGEKETGVTIMEMVKRLDAGDIFLQEKIEIGENETAGELTERLSKLGGKLLLQFLEKIKKGKNITGIPQDENKVTYAPQLNREMAKINWGKKDVEIHNLVRGLNPWPIAFTTFRGKICKIYRTQKSKTTSSKKPGEIIKMGKKMLVSTGNKIAIEILEIQLPGKKVISGIDFLNGNRIEDGERFS